MFFSKFRFLILILGIFTLMRISFLSDGYPNWGDDFAQYLQHGVNIVRGRPYTESPYIYTANSPALGPRAYPPGYPMVLAPLLYSVGIHFFIFKVLNVLLFEFALLFLFLLITKIFKSEYHDIGIITVLFLQFSSVLIDYQTWIMPEFLLVFLVVFNMYFFTQFEAKGVKLFFLRVLWFFSFILIGLTHFLGLIYVFAVTISSIFIFRSKKRSLISFLAIFLCAVIYLHLHIFEGYIGQGGFRPFEMILNIPRNVNSYFRLFSDLITSSYLVKVKVPAVFGDIFILIGMIGGGAALFSKERHRDHQIVSTAGVILLFQMAVLSLYPYFQGIRYLFISIPFMTFIYFLGVFKFIEVSDHLFFHKRKYRKMIFLLICCAGLVPFVFHMRNYLHKEYDVLGEKDTKYLFDYFKNKDEDAVVMFEKPRVLALLTEKHTLLPGLASEKENLNMIEKYRVCYFVIPFAPKDVSVQNALMPFIDSHKENLLVEAWKNDKFTVWKMKKGCR